MITTYQSVKAFERAYSQLKKPKFTIKKIGLRYLDDPGTPIDFSLKCSITGMESNWTIFERKNKRKPWIEVHKSHHIESDFILADTQYFESYVHLIKFLNDSFRCYQYWRHLSELLDNYGFLLSKPKIGIINFHDQSKQFSKLAVQAYYYKYIPNTKIVSGYQICGGIQLSGYSPLKSKDDSADTFYLYVCRGNPHGHSQEISEIMYEELNQRTHAKLNAKLCSEFYSY